MTLAIFFLSIAPSFLILATLFRKQTKIFKMDLGIYLFKLLLCCLLTMRVALALNGNTFANTQLNFAAMDAKLYFYTAFLGIGFNEELAKLLPILLLLYISDRWKNKLDVYFSCIFVGAFFAAFENLFVPTYSALLGNLLLRSLIAVPAHLSFACLMAFFVYLALKCSLKPDAPTHINQRWMHFINYGLQFILFFKIIMSFYEYLPSNAFYGAGLLSGCLVVLFLLGAELILLLYNYQQFSYLLRWNLRLTYLLLALIVPAALHGLHDWGCTIFVGKHILFFYICLSATYTTILVATYFVLNKQAHVKEVEATPKVALV